MYDTILPIIQTVCTLICAIGWTKANIKNAELRLWMLEHGVKTPSAEQRKALRKKIF